jgi:hypothetical protein
MNDQFTFSQKIVMRSIMPLVIMGCLFALIGFSAIPASASEPKSQSANLLAQADVPEDINPNANVSTSTVDPAEVSTSSAANEPTSTDDRQITTSTNNADSQSESSGWGIWAAVIGLLGIVLLLYFTTDE